MYGGMSEFPKYHYKYNSLKCLLVWSGTIWLKFVAKSVGLRLKFVAKSVAFCLKFVAKSVVLQLKFVAKSMGVFCFGTFGA